MFRSFRSTALVAATILTCCAMAATAAAETLTVDRDPSNYSGGNGGGEFKVLTFTGGGYVAMGSGVQVSGGLFQTFCLEANTGISVNTTYNYTLGTSSSLGGVSGGNPDPLDSRTAYLFTQFWNGTLSNYNYTLGSGRTSSAAALQLAIWNIEGELAGSLQTAYNNSSQAQSWVSEADAAVAAGGSWYGNGIGNVRVINPTTAAGADVQSLLVLVPLPSAALLGLGLLSGAGGFALLRRRRSPLLV